MQKNFVRILAGVLVLVLVLGFVAMAANAQESGYASLQEALEAGESYFQLTKNESNVTISQDLVLDLNGYTVTDATVAEGVTVQLVDSANDRYDAEMCGSFAGTVNGTMEQVVNYNNKSYLVIQQDGVYSAHHFFAGITHISLAPQQAALGYKAQFRADETINSLVTGYGYAMWLEGYAVKQYMLDGAIEKQELTLRLKNILSENEAVSQIGATAQIHGQAIIKFEIDGKTLTLTGAEHITTLKDAVESVDAALAADRGSYTAQKIALVRDFCKKFANYMTEWSVNNILSVEKFTALQTQGFTYGQTVTLEQLFAAIEGVEIGENLEITVSGVDATVSGKEITFQGVGTAVITVTDNDFCVPATNTVEIAKATPEVEMLPSLNAVYGQTLAEFMLPEGYTWVDPTQTVGNAGSMNYFAVIYTPADPNYNSVETQVGFAVEKADPEYTIPENLTAVYGQRFEEIALPEGFYWEYSTDEVGMAGTNCCYVNFVPADQENYNTIYHIEVYITVAKADPQVPEIGELIASYGDEISSIQLPNHQYTWESTGPVGDVGTHTHYVTFTPQDTSNYNIVEHVPVTVRVSPAVPVAPQLETYQTVYGQTLADIVLPQYFRWEDASLSVGEVGTQYFNAWYDLNDPNYMPVPVTVTVEVAKANAEAPEVGTLYATYGQTLAQIALDDNLSWKDDSQSVGDVGTKTFTAIYDLGSNYNTIEVEVTVVVAQAEPEYTVPTGLTATEGQTLEDVILPDGFSWKDESESVGEAGTNTFIAIYTPADANYKAVEVEVEVEVAAKIVPTEKYTAALYEGEPAFLYRVGNVNAVALSSLFKALDGTAIDPSAVIVEITNVAGGAAGTYSNGSIQFSGTGVVKVTISAADALPCEITLEVIKATNVTEYSALKNQNSVLLNNITMTSGGSYHLSGATLCGNGFTLDATQAVYTGAGYVSGNYVVGINNAVLDNIVIKGAVYAAVGGKADMDYSRALVVSTGNNVIANCLLSNTCSPVRVMDGSVEIINTTLRGGSYSNLDIRNGKVILDNVTTINQVNGNDTTEDGEIVLGLGITFHYEQVNASTTLEIRNGLTQFNTGTKEEAQNYLREDTAKNLIGVVFGNSYSDIQYRADNKIWVNTGILSMISTVGDDNISNLDGYAGKTVSFSDYSGFLYTKKPTAESIAAPIPAFVSAGQYELAPSCQLDYTTKNYQAKTDGSNDYCYYDSSAKVVMLSMDEGDTFNWDTSILTAQKGSNTLPYTVTMNGTDYTGKSIAFNQAGDYVVTYTYVDGYNYKLGANGEVVTYPKTYTTTVTIQVAVVEAAAKNAEFTFGSNNVASKLVTVGNTTYVMPNVTATSSTIASKTVNGTTIYMPIINCAASNNKTSQSSGTTWYMLFPVFNGVVTITDYADGGTGAAVTYNGSTTTLPSGLAAVDPASTFKYAASAGAPTTPTAKYNKTLCYTSPAMEGVNRDALTIDAQYQYTDNAGKTYYYYVRYKTPKITNSACVTPDTLVTLADGTQKQIKDVTYSDQLLVWDFYKGEYAVVPSAIIFNMGTDNYDILRMKFEDGTVVNVINNHRFLDKDLNAFVLINESNVASYIGHSFVKQDGDSYKTVKLVDYTIDQEYTTSYSIMSAFHYNFIVEGMFSDTFHGEDAPLFDYFKIGEDMKYDAAAMAEDIAAYGLYTYEDFADYLTYEQFVALNVQYMKVSVGKGMFTYEGILDLINTYLSN